MTGEDYLKNSSPEGLLSTSTSLSTLVLDSDRTVDSVAGDEAPAPRPNFPTCDTLDVLTHENRTTTKVMTSPIIDCASKFGEMPPDASSILPRIALHESKKQYLKISYHNSLPFITHYFPLKNFLSF